MKNHRKVFLSLAAAALSISAFSACQSSAEATNTGTTATAAPTATPPPSNNAPPNTAQNKTPRADNPCYVHLFDGDNFDSSDDNDIIYGAGKFGNLRNLPGATDENDWGGEADSLKVGPAATVKVWEKENFQGKTQTYAPGTENSDPDDFESMEITCK